MFKEMCQGLLEESDGEGEPGEVRDKEPEAGGAQNVRVGEDDQTTGVEAEATPGRLRAVERKTEQQRRREKASRILVSPMGSDCFPCSCSLISLVVLFVLFCFLSSACFLSCLQACFSVPFRIFATALPTETYFLVPCRHCSGFRGCGGEHARPRSCCPGAYFWGRGFMNH